MRTPAQAPRGVLGALCTLALAAALPAWAQADFYPSRPITLVVGYPPGGSTDLTGRLIAEELRRILKATVVVENQVGSGGALAAQRVAKATPDGYTLMVASNNELVINQYINKQIKLDGQKDFTPVGMVASQPLVLVATRKAGVRNLTEFVDVVVDAGHADGTRLRDFGRFGDPGGSACSLLTECGYHGDPASRRVAQDAVYLLMTTTGMVSHSSLPTEWRLDQAPAEWALEVTDAVVAQSMSFQCAGCFDDLECLPTRATVIAHDQGKAIATPYDDCTLVMPSLRQLRPGVTVVRFARRRRPR